MAKACITIGRDEKLFQNFLRKYLKGRDRLEELVVDGRIIMKQILDENLSVLCIFLDYKPSFKIC
jgi:hypothetical protein